jgi:hypothetical protein
MTEPPTKEHFPTQEDLEREARRLARVRRLSLVPGTPTEPPIVERLMLLDGVDPDPKEAA